MIGVTENLRLLRDLLRNCAIDAGRAPDSVRLLAVSKKQPLAKVLEAARGGQRDFGENQVQEALDKIAQAASLGLTWHFIGHLQANKTRAVAEHFDWVHSIDRLKIAERLDRQRPAGLPPLNVCLQVNVDEEASKSGMSLDDVPAIAESVAELENLRLRGLMCLPAIRSDFDQQRQPFAKLREMLTALNDQGHDLDTLSMGMTDDYRAAIHEGATIVRIGTAVFGPRE